eukprot:233562_1
MITRNSTNTRATRSSIRRRVMSRKYSNKSRPSSSSSSSSSSSERFVTRTVLEPLPLKPLNEMKPAEQTKYWSDIDKIRDFFEWYDEDNICQFFDDVHVDDDGEDGDSGEDDDYRPGSRVLVCCEEGNEWQATIQKPRERKGERGYMIHYDGMKRSTLMWIRIDKIVDFL